MGEGFSIDLRLNEDISSRFDFYMFVDANGVFYTISMSGAVRPGIEALYRNVTGLNATFVKTIQPAVAIPPNMAGSIVTFYAVVVEAGKMPPVSSPAELTPQTPYVIMLSKKSAEVQ